MQTHFPLIYSYLGGGFNPFEKYARQTGSFPQVGMKKNIQKHKLDILFLEENYRKKMVTLTVMKHT